MSENKQYENEYKVQAVKLAKKLGAVKAANELKLALRKNLCKFNNHFQTIQQTVTLTLFYSKQIFPFQRAKAFLLPSS